MFKRLALLSVVLVGCLTSIVSPASAAATSCSVLQETPTYSSGTVSSSGDIECTGTSIQIYMESWLTRDNTQVDNAYSYGGGSGTQYWSQDVSAPNISGNQQWCASTVVTNANTGARLASDSACESQAWLVGQ